MFACKLCNQQFEVIPNDAVPVSQMRRGYQLFRFKNGELHDLREVRIPALTLEQLSARGKRGAHTRRHINQGIRKMGCKYCFPDTAQAEEKKL